MKSKGTTKMSVETVKGAIGDLLLDVKARSGTITNEYLAEAKLKIDTLVVMHGQNSEELNEAVAMADKVINVIKERNRNPALRIHNLGENTALASFTNTASEDPIWVQQVEALEHALAHYGIRGDRKIDGKTIRVNASSQTLRTSYPIGGTPKEILIRKIPASIELDLSHKQASTIMNALGERFRKYGFKDIVSKISQDKVRRSVKFNRLDFFEILTSLFKLGPETGWDLRVDLLDNYGIQEA